MAHALKAQVDCFGQVEVPALTEDLRGYPRGTALDVGTGDGSFLLKVAESSPGMSFVGMEQDAELFAMAESLLRQRGLSNVRLARGFFDSGYAGEHEVVFTRLTLQHSSAPREFVQTAYRSLRAGGKFVCIEPVYDYYDSEPIEETWRGFRERMLETYRRWGSNPNVPKRASRWLVEAGFESVKAAINLYSPATVGHRRFKDVVLTTVALLRVNFPEVWEEPFLQTLEDWIKAPVSDPFISIAYIVASKRDDSP